MTEQKAFEHYRVERPTIGDLGEEPLRTARQRRRKKGDSRVHRLRILDRDGLVVWEQSGDLTTIERHETQIVEDLLKLDVTVFRAKWGIHLGAPQAGLTPRAPRMEEIAPAFSPGLKILSLAPLGGPAIELLRALGELEIDPWNDHVPIKLHSADELVARLQGHDVLVVEADHVSADVIERSGVRAIAVCRGDPVNIDLAAATARGIPVLSTPARNAEAVAELALALTLSLTRHVVAADDDIRAARFVIDGRIAQQRYRARELRSLVVGLVGFGAVGRAAARLFRAVGATVIASDPFVTASGPIELVTLDDLLTRADVISIHAALNAQTRGLIGAKELGAAKPGALLVNTARFEIVDEAALLDALRSGGLAGAAFDHFAGEYLPEGHPLTAMPNVVLTPHIGGTTVETVEEHTRLVAEGLARLVKGEVPSNLLNPQALEAFQARSRGNELPR
jgi:D-3-phosphoglycerate dehydrogenase / 2-oxoglutarate reductase